MRLILVNGSILQISGASSVVTVPENGVVALSITTSSSLSLTAGVAFNQTFSAIGGTSPYTWNISSGTLPSGLSFSTAGVLSGTTYNESATPSNVVVTVTDSVGNAASLPLTLSILNNSGIPNTPLSVNLTTSSGTITVGATLSSSGPTATSITITSTDGTLGPYAVAPTLTHTFSGLTNGRSYQFNVTANNSVGESVPLLSSPITVGSAIAITSTSPLTPGVVNTAYSTTLAASGGTAPYIWSLSSGTLPTGLSLSSGGIISGTPTQVITDSNLTFSVTDSASNTASGIFTLVIQASASGTIPNPPLFVSANPGNSSAIVSVIPDTSAGAATSYTVSTSDGTVQIAHQTLPITLTGLSNGTTYSLYVTANNSTGVSAKVYTNSVTPAASASPLTITTTTLSTGTSGTAYSATLAATGGTSPYTWSIIQGSLTSGLSLVASTGVITGTPTSVASSTIGVKVIDQAGNIAFQALTLTIGSSGAATVNPPTGLQVILMGQTVATGSSTSSTITPTSPNYTAISWTAPSGSTNPIASYQIWRSTNKAAAVLYATATTTSYADNAATLCINGTAGSSAPYYPANTYQYYVKAVDTAGNVSALSAQHVFNIYKNGYNWAGDFRNGTFINYTATDPAGSGLPVIEVLTTAAYGETLTYSGNLVTPWNQWVGAFNYMYIDLYTTVVNQVFGIYALRSGDVPIYGSNGQPVTAIDPAAAGYGPAYIINTWQTYKIPLSAILTDYGPSGAGPAVIENAFYKWSIQNKSTQVGLIWYMRNIILSV